jgi:hypothetical protein
MRVRRAALASATRREVDKPKPKEPAKRAFAVIWAVLSAEEQVWFVDYIKASARL